MKNEKNEDKYSDIISLPRHISKTRRKMTNIERAAQFSPFAALSGYEEVLAETARTTEDMRELDEEIKKEIDMKIQMICRNLSEENEIAITYFKPDGRKKGGAYYTVKGTAEHIDSFDKKIKMSDGSIIPIKNIYRIDGEMFRMMDTDL